MEEIDPNGFYRETMAELHASIRAQYDRNDFSFEEISEYLDVDVSTVQSWCARWKEYQTGTVSTSAPNLYNLCCLSRLFRAALVIGITDRPYGYYKLTPSAFCEFEPNTAETPALSKVVGEYSALLIRQLMKLKENNNLCPLEYKKLNVPKTISVLRDATRPSTTGKGLVYLMCKISQAHGLHFRAFLSDVKEFNDYDKLQT